MIDERMIADAVKRFRSDIPSKQTQSIKDDTELFMRNAESKDGCLRDAVFYAKLLSQKYNVLAREIETMCEAIDQLNNAEE